MEFLGIGAPELIFIVILALILLGPKDMQKAGKTIGVWLNTVVKSDWWRAIRRTSEEIRSLPTNLMREANREMMDLEKDLKRDIATPSVIGPRPPASSAPVDPNPPPAPQSPPVPPSGNPPAPTGAPADTNIHTEPRPSTPGQES